MIKEFVAPRLEKSSTYLGTEVYFAVRAHFPRGNQHSLKHRSWARSKYRQFWKCSILAQVEHLPSVKRAWLP